MYEGFIIVCIIGFLLIIGVMIFLVTFAAPKTSVQEACTSDSQCPNGTVCVDGACTTKRECNGNNDCPNGSCVGGICTVDTCTENNQCPVGSICQANQCTVSTCLTNAQCPSSSYCINGFCQNRNCVSSANCDSGYGCYKNVCYKLNSSCLTNSNCFGSSLYCLNNVCWGLDTSASCPQGWKVQDGFCFPYLPGECPSGQQAVSGICCPNQVPCGKSCSNNDQCGGSCPYCLDGVCRCQKAEIDEIYPNYPYATCANDSSCLSGKCMNGYCVPAFYQCITNSQCPNPNAAWCIQGACAFRGTAEGSYCLTDQDANKCRSTGRSCVNAICRIRKGTLGELCNADQDCSSGLNCRATTTQLKVCTL